MEKKQGKQKYKILKLLPKAATAMTFQNPPFSPSRDKPHNHHHHHVGGGRGFSGPLMILDEARRRRKNNNNNNNESFETDQEPTSPKVSCIGQIKHKKKTHKAKRPSSPPQERTTTTEKTKKKTTFKFKRFLTRKSKSDIVSADEEVISVDGGAPSVGQMRRFASSRVAFASFDWTAQIAPAGSDHQEGDDSDQEEKEDIIIPFSAPITVGGHQEEEGMVLQPKKEINLWKRRTMNPPRPLRLN